MFLPNNLYNHYTGGHNNKVNRDIISILKNTMPSTTIQDLILNMKCNEQIDVSLFGIVQKDKAGTYKGNYFDPWKITVLSQMFISAAQLNAKDWYEDFQIEKHSKLELHHVFPKAQFDNETYKHYDKLINHISNLAIITRIMNRKIKIN